MCMTQMPKITGEAGETSRRRQDLLPVSHSRSVSTLNFKKLQSHSGRYQQQQQKGLAVDISQQPEAER